jgi:hypothetical protein
VIGGEKSEAWSAPRDDNTDNAAGATTIRVVVPAAGSDAAGAQRPVRQDRWLPQLSGPTQGTNPGVHARRAPEESSAIKRK